MARNDVFTRREFIQTAGTGVAALLLMGAKPSRVSVPADMVFMNGRVYTMDSGAPWAEAVAVRKNIIAGVGRNGDMVKMAGPKTRVIDLKGKMLLPGFIESHIHPGFGSLFSGLVLLNQDGTKEEILNEIRKGVAEKKGDDVIGFMGFKASAFGPEGPKASDLDAIESSKPVLVFDYGGHSMWVNSMALQIAGISKDTPDPLPGGHYYKRDKNGNPTGWCIEPMAFMPVIYRLGITPNDVMDEEKKLFPVISSYGFTTVFDAGSFMQDVMFKAYLQLEKEGQLPFRVYGCHLISNPALLPDAIDELARLNRTYRSKLLTVNTMKVVYDGTLEAASCAMFDEFLNDRGNKGFELFPPEVLNDFVKKVDDAGFNIHIHAIGNRAISDVLGAFENLKRVKGLTPTKKTICHTQFFMPDTVARFKALKDVVAQTTPIWMIPDNNTQAAAGRELYERQALFNSLDREGVTVTFGSDFPVSSGMEGLNPFNEIEVGHTRRNVGAKDTELLPPMDERLSIETLLRGYTINGARQLGIDDRLGSIETGKLADLIVIEKNLFRQDPSDLHNNRVLLTVMNGTIVHDIMPVTEQKRKRA